MPLASQSFLLARSFCTVAGLLAPLRQTHSLHSPKHYSAVNDVLNRRRSYGLLTRPSTESPRPVYPNPSADAGDLLVETTLRVNQLDSPKASCQPFNRVEDENIGLFLFTKEESVAPMGS